jgi:hypothetical protein
MTITAGFGSDLAVHPRQRPAQPRCCSPGSTFYPPAIALPTVAIEIH